MVWIAVTFLVLVISFAFLVYFFTGAMFAELQANLDRLEKAAQSGCWEQAEREAEKLATVWGRAEDYLTPIMDHREVNNLDDSLARVSRLVELRSQENLLVEIALSRRLMVRIKENEVPGVGNVL